MVWGQGMSVEAMRWVFGVCRDIHDGPRLVLLSLAWIADPRGAGEMKLDSLGFMAAMSRSSVQRHMRVLEATRYVTRQARRGRGQASPFQLAMDAALETALTIAVENVSENRSTNGSTVTGYAENRSENVSTNASALTRFGELHLLSTKQQDNNAHASARAPDARAREVAAFTPSERLVTELVNRGFPPDELTGMLERYRFLRSRTGETLTDANLRAFAVTYLRDTLHLPDHGDLSKPQVGRRTADTVAGALTWATNPKGGRS